MKNNRFPVIVASVTTFLLLGLGVCTLVAAPPQAADGSSRPALQFQLDKAIPVDVKSSGVESQGKMCHLVRFSSIQFELDKKTSRLKGIATAWLLELGDVDYDIYAAVYDVSGKLLGTAKAMCDVRRKWALAADNIGEYGWSGGSETVTLDFGKSLDYSRAATFAISIGTRDVPNPDQWSMADELRSASRKARDQGYRAEGMRFRGKIPAGEDGKPIVFAEADLARASFEEVETRLSFHGTNLIEAAFAKTKLDGVDFRDANLERARFVACTLNGTTMVGANCRQAVFIDGRDLCGLNCSDGVLAMARLVKCDMPAARFAGADCMGVVFRDCPNICGGDFSDAKLDKARFVNCDMPAAIFRGASCIDVEFRGCNNLCGANFDDADLRGSRFDSCRLPAARFVGANCEWMKLVNCPDICGGDFSDADLTMARFSHSGLVAAVFANAACWGAIFDNCNLASGVDLSNANLEMATFTKCSLSHARFASANLTKTVFKDCDFTGADLRNVVLADALLENPDLRQADLRGAVFGNSLRGGRFDSHTVYDETTKFPRGFDPVAKGLTRKEKKQRRLGAGSLQVCP